MNRAPEKRVLCRRCDRSVSERSAGLVDGPGCLWCDGEENPGESE